MDKFRVTLCCPIPRVGFGPGDNHLESELPGMEQTISDCNSGDIVVFPEDFLDEKNIHAAESLAAKYGKWIITGVGNSICNTDRTVRVISPVDGEVFMHTKTSLTPGDWEHGSRQGNEINSFDTPFCRIGTVLCYEIHFPEVARIFAVEGARVLFNTVGTGMWHEQQLYEWTTVAKARAIENRCFVLGCTHYCDPLPMIFAYDPHGKEIAFEKNRNGSITVEVDLSLIDERDFERDRNPAVYGKLTEVKR